ncbi:hypothetical protein [Streptomyces sp. 769]|uniref:hypothetical protein n=1 Tax=Streptomyces sp. 769 TaxID=1262452 RepID=UPI00057D0ECD|nr:hypothetical protein [Streptomyces sp. 769]AJC55040.1 hypothetical protein GZL_02449 [Streptomyces sp. 769]
MPDAVDDVMGVVTQQIEDRFQMPLSDLRRAVAAAPRANDDATAVVKWYGLLTEAQEALEKAEDALVAVLGSVPGELDDPAMALAHQVNAAVAVRDGRAMVVRHYLDPHSIGRRGPGAWRGTEAAPRRGPALQTTAAPAPDPAPSVPVRGVSR